MACWVPTPLSCRTKRHFLFHRGERDPRIEFWQQGEKGGCACGTQSSSLSHLISLSVIPSPQFFNLSPLLHPPVCLLFSVLLPVSSPHSSCLSPLLSSPACLLSLVLQPVSSSQFSSLSHLLSLPACFLSSVLLSVLSL